MSARRTLGTLAALAAAWAGTAAQAGSLALSVVDKDGRPAADVVVLVETPTRGAPPAEPVQATIVQLGSRFQPFLTVVPPGSTLRFVNRDGYDHHVRSMPSGPLGAIAPAQPFELRLDAADAAGAPKRAGGTVQQSVKLDATGPVALGCHLHSSMRGQVYVAPTPWFAKTDAEGRAHIDGVPEGAPLQVTLWHPDQLQDQAPLRTAGAGGAVSLNAQLNFVPRRRR